MMSVLLWHPKRGNMQHERCRVKYDWLRAVRTLVRDKGCLITLTHTHTHTHTHKYVGTCMCVFFFNANGKPAKGNKTSKKKPTCIAGFLKKKEQWKEGLPN